VLGNGKPTSQLLRLLLSLFKGPRDATGNVANRALAPTTTAQEAEDYELGTQFGFIIGYNLQILLPAAFRVADWQLLLWEKHPTMREISPVFTCSTISTCARQPVKSNGT
jgi:hypothetical protein